MQKNIKTQNFQDAPRGQAAVHPFRRPAPSGPPDELAAVAGADRRDQRGREQTGRPARQLRQPAGKLRFVAPGRLRPHAPFRSGVGVLISLFVV